MLRRAPRRQTVLVGVFLLLVVMFLILFRMGVVRGQSMTPTYVDGQVVLVSRRHSYSPPLRHNDVVLLRKDRDVIIKRVYRLEGEEIDNAFPYVLGRTIAMNLGDYYEHKVEGGQIHYYVPQGYIVVLGDNLRVSEDSRYFGPVPVRDVLGTAVAAPGPPFAAGANAPALSLPTQTPAASPDRRR
jgi:signal peptidase I